MWGAVKQSVVRARSHVRRTLPFTTTSVRSLSTTGAVRTFGGSVASTRTALCPRYVSPLCTFQLPRWFQQPARSFSQLPGSGKAWVDPKAVPKNETLAKYSVDLTERAKNGKLDPVIGREEEMRRTIEILSRRNKNNPVLMGEPGVGKTAIAEGLAQRIIQNEVPDTIKGKKVLSMDLAAMIAGTQYRGEFEDRFKTFLKEVESDGNIILFVDEMHTLVGAGALGGGSMDASNMLKPALARGDLLFVGATTLNEYRKYIEKDGALARRFQPVYVKEPTVEDTISILRGLKEKYEIHHGVKIKDSAVVSAATMAQKYMTDRKMPDKAIDLLDEAASRLRMQQESKPEKIAHLERRILTRRIELEALRRETDPASVRRRVKIENKLTTLEAEAKKLTDAWVTEKEGRHHVTHLKERLDSLRNECDTAMRSGDLIRASELKYQAIPSLEKELASISTSNENAMLPDSVGEDDVAAVISRHSGIPLSKLLMSEREKLIHMEDVLRSRVIGQDQALHAISNAVRVSRAGLHSHSKPIGTFLFLGPSGVGKTELAKAVAEFMFDDENAMVRIDMSEYMERFSVSRLIGAPPGYVGYDEGGVLTEAVRRRPYQVILFDEAEKAHREVMNLLLQVFDEGHLTDSQGRKVDFRNTLIIMTSNLGASHISRLISAGEIDEDNSEEIEKITMESVRGHFQPEFINRLDQIVTFNRLRLENMAPIVDIQMKELQKLLVDKRIELRVSNNAKKWLAHKGFDPRYGARPLKRAIQDLVLHPLSQRILSGQLEDGVVVSIGVEGDSLTFNKVDGEPQFDREVPFDGDEDADSDVDDVIDADVTTTKTSAAVQSA